MHKFLASLAALSLLAATSASAEPWHEHREYYHEHRGNWVAPSLGGLVIGAVVSDVARQHQERYEDRQYYDYRDYSRRQLVCSEWTTYDYYGNPEYHRSCYYR